MMKMLHATLLSLLIATATAQEVTQIVYIMPVLSGSKCLNVRGSNFKDGTAVEINNCIRDHQATAQRWKITPSESTTQIVVKSEFCLDAIDARTSKKLQIMKCDGNRSQQKWVLDAGKLHPAKNLKLCLDLPNSSLKNGVQVETYACNGGLNQKWKAQL